VRDLAPTLHRQRPVEVVSVPFTQAAKQVFRGDCIDGLDARLFEPGSFALSPA
jgi:hypothetical protein